jgi:hypothetical protein
VQRRITRVLAGMSGLVVLAIGIVTIGPYGEVVRVWPAQALYYQPY